MEILKDKRYWAYYVFTATIIAVILLIEDLLEGNTEYAALLFEFVTDIPSFTLITFLISIGSYQIINQLNKRFPWEEALFKRFVLEISIIIILVIVLTVISSFVVREFGLGPEDTDDDFGYEILALIMYFISIFMVFSFHEFMVLSNDKEYLQMRAKMLQKQNYLIKYEALKNQINPHFLFNSLNVLSSLIYENTAKSDQFIKKFSEVFRYVLELNEEKLVEVRQELKFLDSYFFLQKIRFGDNLEIKKHVKSEALNKSIPPLSLQLAVENAIKHNIISKESRLTIHVENDEECMIVKNNYQSREAVTESTGTGQRNLTEKYALIADQLPKFYIEDNEYIVKLPILEEPAWKEY
ncbi:MAG: histidine kinase [Bacteroidota bacterium]